MERIVHVQTVLPEDVLEELKKKTGEKTTKDALIKAIEHYLECQYIEEDELDGKLKELLRKKLEA
ncbi:MAG: DUF5371 family protein [Methermicoccaceae archaeon]